jgi:hypothetical protein
VVTGAAVDEGRYAEPVSAIRETVREYAAAQSLRFMSSGQQ